jgi:hypothetical protein
VVLEPLWTRSAGMLDREVERVSVALARGAGAELIAQLFVYSSVAGDDLLLPSHSGADGRVRVGGTLNGPQPGGQDSRYSSTSARLAVARPMRVSAAP